MPLLFNQAATKGTLIQGNAAVAIPAQGNVVVKVAGVPENNIKLLAMVYIYDNFSSSEPADFFTLPGYEVRQPRSGFRAVKPYVAGTIIRVIPLYDFTNIRLWYGF